jgi:hypothetical protein
MCSMNSNNWKGSAGVSACSAKVSMNRRSSPTRSVLVSRVVSPNRSVARVVYPNGSATRVVSPRGRFVRGTFVRASSPMRRQQVRAASPMRRRPVVRNNMRSRNYSDEPEPTVSYQCTDADSGTCTPVVSYSSQDGCQSACKPLSYVSYKCEEGGNGNVCVKYETPQKLSESDGYYEDINVCNDTCYNTSISWVCDGTENKTCIPSDMPVDPESGYFSSQGVCEAVCNPPSVIFLSWVCDENGYCSQSTSPVDPDNGYFASQSDCTAFCGNTTPVDPVFPSWECDGPGNDCKPSTENPDGTRYYDSSIACNIACNGVLPPPVAYSYTLSNCQDGSKQCVLSKEVATDGRTSFANPGECMAARDAGGVEAALRRRTRNLYGIY